MCGLPDFNMLFQLVLTKFFKSELFSCLLDCERSLFSLKFSEGSAHADERWAAKPRDARNEGGSPRRKKKNRETARSLTLRSRFTCLACQPFSFHAKKSLDRERPFSLALRVVYLFSCLSRLAPSVTRVVICVSRAFCSTDQEKGETARSLASQTEEKKQSDFLEMKCNLASFYKLNRPRTSKQIQISLI